MMQDTTFTLAVNYWPRKKAMYWWKDFDRAEVEAEFGEIAALKLRVARIFLFWKEGSMSRKGGINLKQVLGLWQAGRAATLRKHNEGTSIVVMQASW